MYALAHAYLESNRRDSAKDVVQVAVELADPVVRVLPSADLSELVGLQVAVGEPLGARQTAELAENGPHRVAALVSLAVAQAKAGDRKSAGDAITRALQIVAEITRVELWRFTEWREVWFNPAAGGLDIGEPAERMASARHSLAKTLHTIGSARLAIGDADGAFGIAREMQRAGESAQTPLLELCKEIAAKSIEARNFQDASDAINLIDRNDAGASQVLRAVFFRERVNDEFSRGEPSGLLQLGIDLDNRVELADKKLQALAGYAEGIVAFKSVQASHKLKGAAQRGSSP